MKSRFTVYALFTGAVLAVASCTDTAAPPLSEETGIAATLVSPLDAYHAALANPEGWGNIHNSELAAIASRMRARKQERGRKINIQEMCDIVTSYVVASGGQRVAAELDDFNNMRGRPNRLSRACPALQKRPGKVPMKASTVSPAGFIGNLTEMDWIDSTFAEPFWDPAEFDLSTVAEDEQNLVNILYAITDAVDNSTATDLNGILAEIQNAVGALGPQEEGLAEWTGEASALAHRSAEFWDTNYYTWEETVCPEDPGDILDPNCEEQMNVRLSSVSGDPCLWCKGGKARNFVIDDALGMIPFGLGLGVAEVFWEDGAKARWHDTGVGDYQEEVRGRGPKTRRELKNIAGKVFRRRVIVGGIVGAVVTSAGSYFVDELLK